MLEGEQSTQHALGAEVVRRRRAEAASAKTQGMTPHPLTSGNMLIVMVQNGIFTSPHLFPHGSWYAKKNVWAFPPCPQVFFSRLRSTMSSAIVEQCYPARFCSRSPGGSVQLSTNDQASSKSRMCSLDVPSFSSFIAVPILSFRKTHSFSGYYYIFPG